MDKNELYVLLIYNYKEDDDKRNSEKLRKLGIMNSVDQRYEKWKSEFYKNLKDINTPEEYMQSLIDSVLDNCDCNITRTHAYKNAVVKMKDNDSKNESRLVLFLIEELQNRMYKDLEKSVIIAAA